MDEERNSGFDPHADTAAGSGQVHLILYRLRTISNYHSEALVIYKGRCLTIFILLEWKNFMALRKKNSNSNPPDRYEAGFNDRNEASIENRRELQKSRIIFCFIVLILFFIVIILRFGYWQIVRAEDLSTAAVEQQTKNRLVTSERGYIYDTNMKTLALNRSGSEIRLNPAKVKELEKKEKGSARTLIEKICDVIPDIEEDELYDTVMESEKSSVLVSKFVEQSTRAKLDEAFTITDDNGKETTSEDYNALQISDVVQRYYPMGEFASHVIGSTNADNIGRFGIEQYYNQYLNGEAGRSINSTDVNGRNLSTGIQKYYSGTEGLNVVLTIDEVIQHYVEKALKEVQSSTSADSVMAIAMNPKTGAVLAMASYPDFDLNDPTTPLSSTEQEKLEEMTDSEKVEYWNQNMWRNPLISDTYEPGSPFKLLTTSMALEEGLTSINDTFSCPGTVTVSGQPLRCWRYYAPHGTETLAEGVANSCNPVFIALSRRLGISTFYDYLERYNFNSKTGIDYSGEANAIIQNQDNIGQVELATMSYGQGIAVTPIQLITAFTAIGNEGKMMKPRLVDKLVDEDGNTVTEFQPEIIRQVISKSTADDLCRMMEGVVRNGTGKSAYIPGYRIGGKTGTAQKVVNGKYTSYTYSSFFAMAPMDDPQFALLLIVDSPKGVHSGARTAGPGVYSIMNDTLKYLNITPVYTDGDTSDPSSTVTVPNVTGMSYVKAKKELDALRLEAIPCPGGTEDFKVSSQYPEEGETLSPGSSVCLYAE